MRRTTTDLGPLLFGLVAVSGLLPGSALALGLGGIQVKSALSQPFEAEIDLVQDRAGEADLANVHLAAPEAFARAGLDRRYFLTGFRFEVEQRSNGTSYVRVYSTEAVREPYIDFLVEVVWPGGNVLRQYTVLLDPPARPWAGVVDPSLGQRPPPVTRAPSAPRQAREAAAAPRGRPQTDPFAGATAPVSGEAYGPVRPGDTLWSIAARARPAGVSQAQAMAAIMRANPEAFIGGDPGRLMAGSRLTVPDAPRMAQQPDAEARTSLAPYIPGWSRPTPRPTAPEPVAESKPAPEPAPESSGSIESADAEAEPGGALRLLQSDEAAQASGSGADTTDQVLLLEETLDVARQENAALRERLEALEAQVASLSEALGSGREGGTERGDAAAAVPVRPDTAAEKPPTAPEPGPQGADGAPFGAAAAASEADPGGGNGWLFALGALAAGLLGAMGLVVARRRRSREAQPSLETAAPVVPGAVLPGAAADVESAPPDLPDEEPIEVGSLDDASEPPGTDADASRLDLLAALLAAGNTAAAGEVYAELLESGDAEARVQADALWRNRA